MKEVEKNSLPTFKFKVIGFLSTEIIRWIEAERIEPESIDYELFEHKVKYPDDNKIYFFPEYMFPDNLMIIGAEFVVTMTAPRSSCGKAKPITRLK